jgi:hypothetical protein
MKPIKVASHSVKIVLVKKIQNTDDREAQIDTQMKEIEVAIMSDGGRRKPFSSILVSIVHEIGHEADFITNHEVFCDDDDEQRDIKERALDALAEVIVQILIDNKLLTPEWLQSLKDEINRVWRNDAK